MIPLKKEKLVPNLKFIMHLITPHFYYKSSMLGCY